MDTLKSLSDEELVRRYANGENKAFDVILERYQSRLYSYIFYFVKNEELTEDIFQETFVKAITTIKQQRYTENGKFISWLTRIAHNMIIDNFRQERYENTVSNDVDDRDLLNNSRLADGNVEDRMVLSQIHADVCRMVELLPENQREVLIMRYYKDMSFKEIADATQVSINTALGRMRYALLNMRKMAEEHQIQLSF